MQFDTCRSIIQLLVMISKLSVVKLLHSEKTAAACSIGAWQIRLASASVIPDGVGHAKFGCNGPDGRVMMGGWTVSLAVIIMFLTTLQCHNVISTANIPVDISYMLEITYNHWITLHWIKHIVLGFLSFVNIDNITTLLSHFISDKTSRKWHTDISNFGTWSTSPICQKYTS